MDFTHTLSTILESYGTGSLNPNLWMPDGSLRPEIRNKLNLIAHDFCKQHVIPSEAINDITLTGSMANYNWSEHSDIDLHVLVDFELVDENNELLNDYYRLAKSMWNSTHDIKVCGHEVEVYIQDSREPHHSTGIYSITSGEWIEEPSENTSTKPDMHSVQQKAEDFVARIDKIERMVEEGEGEAFDEAERVRERIKSMRKAGLESAGEFSIENLAFKYLRNKGHLDRLSRLRRTAYDDQFTVSNCEAEPQIGEDVMKLRNAATSDTMCFDRGDTIVIEKEVDWDKRLRNLKKRRDPDDISTQPIDIALRESDDFDPNEDTAEFSKEAADENMVSGKDILDAHNTLQDLDAQYRAGKNPNVPLDFEQRLELALRDSKRASDTAMWSAKEVNQLRHDMQRGFGDIMTKLDRIARGEPEPPQDEPGSSIFDDE